VTFIASNRAHILETDARLHRDCLNPSLAAKVHKALRIVESAWAVLTDTDNAFIERGPGRVRVGPRLPFPVTVADDVVTAVDRIIDRGGGVLTIGIFDRRSADQQAPSHRF
jgi:hypothetical protein